MAERPAVRLRCLDCASEVAMGVTPMNLVDPATARSGRAGEPFQPEPGDQLQFVDLNGYSTLVWFDARHALRCSCGGRRVQVL